MGFGIDCVFVRLRSYESQKAHVIATHVCWLSRLYLLLVLQTAKIVYIDESYRSNTIVSTECFRPQNSISLWIWVFFTISRTYCNKVHFAQINDCLFELD